MKNVKGADFWSSYFYILYFAFYILHFTFIIKAVV
jgi:hypothetical protein